MSTFPINTTIPAANNDPADDQPLMQANFANINSYVQVDHINPAATGAGQHKQVTFNSNNVPTPPTSPPILFTNIQDGAGNALPGSPAVPELFFYSGPSAGVSQNQYVSTQNGSVLLMGGIIMKWGVYTVPLPGGTQVVPFPVSFPNNCFSVVVGRVNTNSLAGTPLSNFIPASFTITVGMSNISTQTISYIAIGN